MIVGGCSQNVLVNDSSLEDKSSPNPSINSELSKNVDTGPAPLENENLPGTDVSSTSPVSGGESGGISSALLSLGDAIGDSNIEVPLNLEVGNAVALQFDIEYSSIFEFKEFVLESGINKDVAKNNISSGTTRVIVYSLNTDIIPKGKVGTIRVLRKSADTFNPKLSNIVLSDSTGNTILR